MHSPDPEIRRVRTTALLALGVIAAMLLTGCGGAQQQAEETLPDVGVSADVQAPPPPERVTLHPARAHGYLTRDDFTLYLVESPDHVLRVSAPLPGQKQALMEGAVAATAVGVNVSAHHGPDVAELILPKGETGLPLAQDSRFRKLAAAGGRYICENVPARGSFAWGTVIRFSFTDVNFGDGKLHDLPPTDVKLEAWPP